MNEGRHLLTSALTLRRTAHWKITSEVNYVFILNSLALARHQNTSITLAKATKSVLLRQKSTIWKNTL